MVAHSMVFPHPRGKAGKGMRVKGCEIAAVAYYFKFFIGPADIITLRLYI
jgi:hypothetical protein